MRLMSNVLPASLDPPQRQGAFISKVQEQNLEKYLKRVTASNDALHEQVVKQTRECFKQLETTQSGLLVEVFLGKPSRTNRKEVSTTLKVRQGNNITYSPDRNPAIQKLLQTGLTSFIEVQQGSERQANKKRILMARMDLNSHFETREDLDAQLERLERLLQDTLALEEVAEGFNPKTDDLKLVKPSSKKS